MTNTLLVLAQAYPLATTLTDIYVVPPSTSVSVTSIFICNQGSQSIYFNISVAVGGSFDSPVQYIFYNLFLDAYDTFATSVDLSLASKDVIRVYSTLGTASFSIFGVQIT